VRELGGVVVRIERPGVAQDASHVSEAQDFPVDLVIRNDGMLEQYTSWPRRSERNVVVSMGDLTDFV